MEGLAQLMQSLFAIELRVTEFGEGESWHPSVYRVELLEQDGTLAGVVYLGTPISRVVDHDSLPGGLTLFLMR